MSKADHITNRTVWRSAGIWSNAVFAAYDRLMCCWWSQAVAEALSDDPQAQPNERQRQLDEQVLPLFA